MGLVAASAASAGSATIARPETTAHRCPAGSKHAVIAGKHRCLRAGQRCLKKYDRQYHRYGFHCHTGRLTRRNTAPPPPPPPPPPSADLGLAITDVPDPVLVRASVTYTLAVSNAGPNAAEAVTVTDTLPAGVTLVSAATSQGSCSGTGPLTCSLGALANSAGASVTIVVRTSTAGTLTNTALVRSQTSDPNTANNSAVATTIVTPESPPPAPPPNCHPSYPDVCIAPPPPDLDCGDIPYRNFRVIYTVPDPDPHRFDGDRDGIGCET